MQRDDVLLAELHDFLKQHGSSASTRVVLVAAVELSSSLPCCQQSLGYKNAQVTKVWSPAHLKSDECRDYWRDVHLVCVRRFRKNSSYATVEEVMAITGDTHAFLHDLPPVNSPMKRITSSTKPILGPRTPSGVSANVDAISSRATKPASASARRTTSLKAQHDDASPTQKVAASRMPAKPRASEPLLSQRGPAAVRSPIVTRRKSNSALQAQAAKTSVSPQPPVPSARSPLARTLARKASDSALLSNATRRTSTATGQSASAARSVSGSAIPTPVRRRSSLNLLAGIPQGSPASPTQPLRASQLRRRSVQFSSVAVQTELDLNAEESANTISALEAQLERLQREHDTVVAYNRDMELENTRLRKQKDKLSAETTSFKDKVKNLESDIRMLEIKNADLVDENGWIVVCKTEEEEKVKKLQRANKNLQDEFDTLQDQFEILSNQRAELEGMALRTREELNDALDEIARLEAVCASELQSDTSNTTSNSDDGQEVAARSEILKPVHDPQVTPMRTPVTRFRQKMDPHTVYATPYATVPKQGLQANSNARPSEALGSPLQQKRGYSPRQPTPHSVKKVTTPLHGSAKRQKHGLRFWKRMAKHRMFS